MKNNYRYENSKRNIIPLSISNEIKEALKEWKFSGEFIDHENATEICGLCEHPEIRYHYEIINIDNLNRLWVGSSCIIRFSEIGIYDATGNQLTNKKDRKKYLEEILKKDRSNKILNPINQLWEIDKELRESIKTAKYYYDISSGFDAQHLATLFEWMKFYNISYNPKIFPISFRYENNKIRFFELDKNQLELIEESLTEEQKRKYLYFHKHKKT